MTNADFHCLTVEKIAIGLGELNEKTAFVGGAVVGREAVLAQLPYLIQAERFVIILNKVRDIVSPHR